MGTAAKIHLFAGVMALFGLLAVFAAWSLTQEARSIARDGIDRTATIVNLRERTSTNTQNGTRSTDYLVSITYTEPKKADGTITAHRATKRVSKRFYSRLGRGEKLTIKMLPDDPEKIEIEPGWVRGNAWAAGIVALFFMACAAGIEWLFFAHQAKLKYMKAKGLEALAKVRFDSNWNGPMMELSFVNHAGTLQTATQPRPKPGTIEGLEDGTQIPVIYDPKGRYRPMLKAQLA